MSRALSEVGGKLAEALAPHRSGAAQLLRLQRSRSRVQRVCACPLLLQAVEHAAAAIAVACSGDKPKNGRPEAPQGTVPGAAPGVHVVSQLANGEWTMPSCDYGALRYSLHARKSMQLTVPDMQSLSRRLTDTATALGGRYDGWAANQSPPA